MAQAKATTWAGPITRVTVTTWIVTMAQVMANIWALLAVRLSACNRGYGLPPGPSMWPYGHHLGRPYDPAYGYRLAVPMGYGHQLG
jgi:hypothetical protein